MERWLGPLLIALGGVGLLVGAAMYLGWIVPPRPPIPPGVDALLYVPRLRDEPELYLFGGLALLALGVNLTRHFRRERLRSRPSV